MINVLTRTKVSGARMFQGHLMPDGTIRQNRYPVGYASVKGAGAAVTEHLRQLAELHDCVFKRACRVGAVKRPDGSLELTDLFRYDGGDLGIAEILVVEFRLVFTDELTRPNRFYANEYESFTERSYGNG